MLNTLILGTNHINLTDTFIYLSYTLHILNTFNIQIKWNKDTNSPRNFQMGTFFRHIYSCFRHWYKNHRIKYTIKFNEEIGPKYTIYTKFLAYSKKIIIFHKLSSKLMNWFFFINNNNYSKHSGLILKIN